jgi:hypothetical protein
MSGQQKRRWKNIKSLLCLPLLVLAATAARADQAANYTISGSTGATLWGLGNQPGTEAVAFAFSAAAPQSADPSAPPALAGPRVAFSVSQWVLANRQWVQRHWYGDWPLAPDVLAIADDLNSGSLDSMVLGTLEERSSSGTVVTPNVFGHLHFQWTGSSNRGNTSTAYTYQTPSYTTTLQSVGSGRLAMASGMITVPALGAPITLWGIGNLSAVSSGLLNVTMP